METFPKVRIHPLCNIIDTVPWLKKPALEIGAEIPHKRSAEELQRKARPVGQRPKNKYNLPKYNL